MGLDISTVAKEIGVIVGEVGEAGLIDRITARLTPAASTVLGPGDDAAVLRIGGGQVIASTDVAVEGTHFRRSWSPAYDIGRRAAAGNLADIAAMGAAPTALLVSLCCPPDTEVSWIEELTDGLRDEAAQCSADIVGGDVARDDHVSIAITALGEMRGAAPVRRAGAAAGDVVAVAGRLGWAAGGLTVLRRGFRSPAALVGAFRRPEPPYAQGPIAAALGATAMCDVSDGLVADAGSLADAGRIGIDLRRDLLPIGAPLRDIGAALNLDPLSWVLGGGEDHALLATFASTVGLPEPWQVIGSVHAGAGVTLDGALAEDTVSGVAGFDHFAATSGR